MALLAQHKVPQPVNTFVSDAKLNTLATECFGSLIDLFADEFGQNNRVFDFSTLSVCLGKITFTTNLLTATLGATAAAQPRT